MICTLYNNNIVYMFIYVCANEQVSERVSTWKTACDLEEVALASVGCCVLFLLPLSSICSRSSADLGYTRQHVILHSSMATRPSY